MHLLKKPAILVFTILVSFLFVFATTKTSSNNEIMASAPLATDKHNFETNTLLFSELHLNEAGMNSNVFNSALEGLEKLDARGAVKNDDIITIIDFQPAQQ